MSHFCEECLLVQLEEFVRLEEIFTEYTYFSSCTNTWLQHARDYTDLMVERFALDPQSRVVEVASNDGYLLQYFAKKHIPVLRIEPAVNAARAAIEMGIPTRTEFFWRGVRTSSRVRIWLVVRLKVSLYGEISSSY